MILLHEQPLTYLIIALVMFSAGLFTVLTRKNILAIIMGVELMLNASAINFITFSHFREQDVALSGHVFAIMIIVLAAAETVVALAILLAIFQQRKAVTTDDISDMKG